MNSVNTRRLNRHRKEVSHCDAFRLCSSVLSGGNRQDGTKLGQKNKTDSINNRNLILLRLNTKELS